MKKIDEIGIVKAQQIKRQRERDPQDVISRKGSAIKKKLTPQANQKLSQTYQKQKTQGKLGGGSTSQLKSRRYGILSSTEMDWTKKLVEMLIKR